MLEKKFNCNFMAQFKGKKKELLNHVNFSVDGSWLSALEHILSPELGGGGIAIELAGSNCTPAGVL